MSGVTEVQLYHITVDTVPTKHTEVTTAVLNSSRKDHTAGIKRYLGGVATLSGLAGPPTSFG
jgi:hypothetical protein